MFVAKFYLQIIKLSTLGLSKLGLHRPCLFECVCISVCVHLCVFFDLWEALLVHMVHHDDLIVIAGGGAAGAKGTQIDTHNTY